jgi:hypothetical protein
MRCLPKRRAERPPNNRVGALQSCIIRRIRFALVSGIVSQAPAVVAVTHAYVRWPRPRTDRLSSQRRPHQILKSAPQLRLVGQVAHQKDAFAGVQTDQRRRYNDTVGYGALALRKNIDDLQCRRRDYVFEAARLTDYALRARNWASIPRCRGVGVRVTLPAREQQMRGRCDEACRQDPSYWPDFRSTFSGRIVSATGLSSPARLRSSRSFAETRPTSRRLFSATATRSASRCFQPSSSLAAST